MSGSEVHLQVFRRSGNLPLAQFPRIFACTAKFGLETRFPWLLMLQIHSKLIMCSAVPEKRSGSFLFISSRYASGGTHSAIDRRT